jgi:hypothetical protein
MAHIHSYDTPLKLPATCIYILTWSCLQCMQQVTIKFTVYTSIIIMKCPTKQNGPFLILESTIHIVIFQLVQKYITVIKTTFGPGSRITITLHSMKNMEIVTNYFFAYIISNKLSWNTQTLNNP